MNLIIVDPSARAILQEDSCDVVIDDTADIKDFAVTHLDPGCAAVAIAIHSDLGAVEVEVNAVLEALRDIEAINDDIAQVRWRIASSLADHPAGVRWIAARWT